YRAVRTPRWLYVEYRAGARELYDLKRDPNELRSLDAEPGHLAIRAALHRVLGGLATCSGAGCRKPLPKLPEPPEGRQARAPGGEST
ncbi:MAG: hypothetical protein WAO08_15480, partial [Hyphomicrobiaceae bacterium]